LPQTLEKQNRKGQTAKVLFLLPKS